MTQSSEQGDGRSSYSVTLILTDGAIIIGVGNAALLMPHYLSAMDDFDCDDGLLRSSSGRTAHDMVSSLQTYNLYIV